MEIVEDRVVWESGHTLARERSYRDRSGATRTWSYIERRGKRQAVVIVARTRVTGSLVMIRQFRVPFGRTLVELPAGLVDPGESPAIAATRELGEETGYTGEVVEVGPEVSSTAGLTTETYRMVWMAVGETPQTPPRHEASESIQVFTVSPVEAARRLAEWEEARELLDGKAHLALRALVK